MTPAQHQRVSEVFLAATRLDATAREEYVQSACGSDLAVRDKVVAMLTQYDAPKVDLETPALVASLEIGKLISQLPNLDNEQIPERLGNYRILDVLGKGGMGVVYRAEQQNPKRTVALKAIRQGLMGAKSLQRFALEAEALARLQHPGIAQIFEAGADESGDDRSANRPYFAMELVEGEPLTEYADRRQLTIRQRVKLLAEICDAVQHAHTKSVIHRDLKPSNIVIDASGRSKVLDFGVARIVDGDGPALTNDTDGTQLVGTLQYMSPQQVSGDSRNIDTKCDVYALGVIGYELLAGKPPYDLTGKNIPQASGVIIDSVAPRLSRLDRRLAGDLETIIHKALEKDPDQRYQTAGELAADLRRYLAHEPIVARPPSLRYQVRKFAQRQRLAFVASVAACLAMIIGAAGVIRGGIVAERQRSEAERQFEIASAINDFLNEDLLSLANPLTEPASDITVKEALDRASRKIASRFPNRDEVRAAIELTIGRTYMALGNYAKAEPHLKEAVTIHQSLHDATDTQSVVANVPMVELLRRTGRLDEAAAIARESLDLLESVNGIEHIDTLSSMDALASVELDRGNFDEAETILTRALKTVEATDQEGELAVQIRGSLSDTYKWQGRYEDAAPLNERIVVDARRIWGANDARTAIALNKLATLYLRQGRFADGRPLLEEAAAIAVPILGESHPDVLTINGNLGTALMNLEQYAEAAKLLQVIYDQTKESLGDNNMDVIINGQALGTAYRYLERYGDARRVFEETVEAADATLGQHHPQSLYARSYLGLTLIDLVEFEEAEVLLRETLELYRTTIGDDHPNTLHAENDLAKLLVRIERYDEAEAIYEHILSANYEEAPHAKTVRAIFQTDYGRCLTKMGKFDDAQVQLTAADDYLSDSQWANKKYGRDALEALVELYEALNEPESLSQIRDRLEAHSQ